VSETAPRIEGVEVGRRLAIGGMAEIFLAKEMLAAGKSRPVVVKRLLPRADALWKELFEREKRALGHIDSLYVVKLFRSGPDFLLLEYIDGPDLEQLITHYKKRGQRLPLQVAGALLSDLLQGLDDLHRATDSEGQDLGLVHRDINPSNILVNREGITKLIDLGVVHTLATRDQTQVGVKGTLAYMAPEQLAAKQVDLRTDIYAAGLVAYELLTGSPARPPGKLGLAELIQARSSFPELPSSVNPSLPTELNDALLKALDPDPAGRFASAREFSEALLDALGVDSDRETLIDMVAKVQKVELASSSTVGVSLSGSTDVQTGQQETAQTVVETTAPSKKSMLVLAALILVVVGLALWTVLNQPTEQTRLAFQGTPKAPLETSGQNLVSEDVSPSVDSPLVSRDVVSKDIVQSKDKADLSSRKEAPSNRRRREAPKRPKRIEVKEVKTPRMFLAFRTASGSSLHVKGQAVDDGFAPILSKELQEGANLFQLRGSKGLQAVVRVNRRGEELNIRLGAPPGR